MRAFDLTPAELDEVRRVERRGGALIAYRDGSGLLRIVELGERRRVVIGRSRDSDVPLHWDVTVSRAHALLERLADQWVLVDDGLSRYGSFVNGERVTGRRRLTDRDILVIGKTRISFRWPSASDPENADVETLGPSDRIDRSALRPAQLRVLAALCRPVLTGAPGTVPASNSQIADELTISIDGVRTQMRILYERLEIPELPQARRRAELVKVALAAGIVGRADV